LQLDLIKAAEESCHEGVKIHWRLINQIYRFFTFLRQNNQILKQDTYQSFVAWYEAKAKDTLSKFYNSLTIKVDDANSLIQINYEVLEEFAAITLLHQEKATNLSIFRE